VYIKIYTTVHVKLVVKKTWANVKKSHMSDI